ncbi:MAG: hypothetical protein PHO10_07290 [Gemmiger sp.]|nr:hypothetical protein [Gemmiger sp.]
MKKGLLQNKAAGFYAGLVAAALCIAAAVTYSIWFSKIAYKEPLFNQTICIVLAVTAVAGAVMLFVEKLAPYAPVLLCVGSGVSLLMYIHAMIWPVADTIYGIEPFAHMRELTICAALLGLGFVVSEVALYLKKVKKTA